MNDLRFGLVGFGLWGSHHARAIAGTPGACLAAVAAPSQETRAAARQAYPQAQCLADYRELVTRPDIDVVDVVAPNHLHYEIALAALAAGKHVLVEKPMVLATHQAAELIQLARQNNRLLAVNHELRVSSLWGRVKQLIDSGLIGTPQYAILELSRFPYRPGSQGWRYDPHRVGDWILEEPIHFFDLARWYMTPCGQPVSLYSRANSRQPRQPDLHDNFTTIMNFPHGAFAVISQTLAAFEHHVTCKVTGSGGALWANWSAPDARHPQPTFGLRYSTDHEHVEEVPYQRATGEVVELEQQIASVVAAIRNGTPPIATAEDGYWAVAICLAAKASVHSGTPVEITPP